MTRWNRVCYYSLVGLIARGSDREDVRYSCRQAVVPSLGLFRIAALSLYSLARRLETMHNWPEQHHKHVFVAVVRTLGLLLIHPGYNRRTRRSVAQ